MPLVACQRRLAHIHRNSFHVDFACNKFGTLNRSPFAFAIWSPYHYSSCVGCGHRDFVVMGSCCMHLAIRC